MNNAELLAALRAQVMEVQEITYPKLLSAPGSAEGKSFRDAWLHVQCPASKWADLARALKETPSLDFDLLNMVTAVDYFKPLAGEPHFDLVYQFLSFRHRHKLVVKVTVPRENSSVASVVAFWPTADWQEREVYDMYGVRFDGHPNCTRILMWDGFPGWPLRKDFAHIPDRYDD
jgi:NADH-quinone oxidoreductase subunit C